MIAWITEHYIQLLGYHSLTSIDLSRNRQHIEIVIHTTAKTMICI